VLVGDFDLIGRFHSSANLGPALPVFLDKRTPRKRCDPVTWRNAIIRDTFTMPLNKTRPTASAMRFPTAGSVGTHANQGGWLEVPYAQEAKVVKKEQGRVVETATEARQAEPGPSILLILIVSVVLAVTILGVIWFIFFRT
jgi:cobalamin biosynthesis Mg chelatase CobN